MKMECQLNHNLALFHANFHRQIYLSELASLAQLSEYHFCRMFKESLVQTPQEYLMQVRIEHVKNV